MAGSLNELQASYVERVKASGTHLIGLINEILDLAKVEAGEMVVDTQDVALGSTLRDTLSMTLPQAAAKGVEIVEDSSCAPELRYSGDEVRVRQILLNLVSNAVKFTPAGGRVTIRCEASDDRTPGVLSHGDHLPGSWLWIHVEDTGVGIAPDQLSRVFAPFIQVDDTYTRRQGGTGLGLTISREFARLMGGDLMACSTEEIGSCFTLRLPVAVSRATHGTLEEAPSAPVVVAFGADASMFAELEARLHPDVRLLWTSESDHVALLTHQESARLVVLDVSDADGAGWRFAHRLPGLMELADTAILLLTGVPAETDPGHTRGWISVLPKPFSADQLTRAVRVATEPSAPGEHGAHADGYLALIVDDDPDTRHIASAFLNAIEVRVQEAADGVQALAAMRRDRPDVIIMDLMMPVLNGFDVLKAMRTDAAMADIPVVVLTAKTLTDAERRFLDDAAVHVLQKGSHQLDDVASLVLRTILETRRPAAVLPHAS